MVVYRIEDQLGLGPFFFKDGQPRDGAPYKNKIGLYSFMAEWLFLKKEYYKYYKDNHYTLYKIVIRKPLQIYLNGEVRFLEKDIAFKIPINKKYVKKGK